MSETKEYLADKKWVVLIIVLAVSVVVSGIMTKQLTRRKPARSAGVSAPVAPALGNPTQLVDGYDWKMVDSLAIPESDKTDLKIALVKVTVETLNVMGSDFLPPAQTVEKYTEDIETFYKDAGNMEVPLLFGLKIVNMTQGNTPPVAVELYKRSLLSRLQKSGFIPSK